MIKVIIAGGGTGGHIFPGLAIAASLRMLNPSVELLFVGAKGKMEMQRVPEAGYNIIGIDIAGFNRSSLFKNIGLPFKLIKSYFQVKRILKDFKPDAVVGVGGYSSFPVLRVAQSAGIPTFIHESNSLPGRTNIMLGKRANGIFVAIDGMEKYFPPNKITISGNPVRAGLLMKKDRTEAIQFFGLNPEYKTVFVVGGSLGARSINETIAENLDYFKKNQVQLIWQTGKNFSAESVLKNSYPMIYGNAFITRMDLAYAAADVVVARSGAMTVTELQVQGKAAIFVPFPFAAEDHQTVNAKKLVDKQAALLVADGDVKVKLIPMLDELINDDEKRKELERNILSGAKTDADFIIADTILKNINA